MSRAEDAAMKAYPPFICNEGQVDEEDLNLNNRECFVEGYRSAETDLALTWEDVKSIVNIADELTMEIENTREGITKPFMQSEESFFKEVMKRYGDGK